MRVMPNDDEQAESGWRTVANMVRAHMQREGLSLAAFARRSGVSDATLRPLLVEGTPIRRADKRAQLGEALGIGAAGIDYVIAGLPPGGTGRKVAVDAIALELVLEDLTRVALDLRRVVDAGSPVELGDEERPPGLVPVEP